MPEPDTFGWTFHTPLPEQTAAFTELAVELGAQFQATLMSAPDPAGGLLLRAQFAGEADAAEARGRDFWLELHSRCLDANLLLELVDTPSAPAWSPLSALAPLEAAWRCHEQSGHPLPPIEARPQATSGSDQAKSGEPPAPTPRRPSAAAPESALAPLRPPIPTQPLYDLLRADDPDLDRNLDETIAWIERAGLPVINLLSYLDLPLFQSYAAEHEDERDQNQFLHMLHTWACYRRFGELHARIPLELAEAFTDPRYLRLNTTQFRSPAPALCVQLPDWAFALRPTASSRLQWAKEVYLTHLEPPTPADDRELTLMIVTYDERGDFGFVPLELPLSLPAVGESIEAFFAPGLDDAELGANTADLRQITVIAATYCLYASSADPARYLHST
jgi:hypothetical protein